MVQSSQITPSSQGDYTIDNANGNTLFDLDKIQRRICSMSTTDPKLIKRDDMVTDAVDLPLTNTFQSSDRHTDVSPQSLSERWGISLSTASKTLQKTTQQFLRSAVLPLGRRYRQD